MKFKHLLLASLGVCAFASCSDNNAPKEIEYKDFDAQLSISAVPMNEVTKASVVNPGEDETGTVNEQYVHTLTAYVFNSVDDSYAGMGTATAKDGNSVDRVEDILIKVKAEKAGDISESIFKVVLLANVKPEKTPSKLSDLAYFSGIENYSFDGVKNGEQYLPMASTVITIGKLVAGTDYDNWVENSGIKYTTKDNKLLQSNGSSIGTEEGKEYVVLKNDRIPLIRYVARIQLESLESQFIKGNEEAVFKLEKVYLANVSNASRYTGDNFEYIIPGKAEGSYDESNAFMRGEFDFTPVDHYLASSSKLSTLTKDYSQNPIVISNVGGTITFKDATMDKQDLENLPEMAQFYAFEFDGYEISEGNTVNTSLIIEGTWSNAGFSAKRYFRIPIKHDTDVVGIKRNYIYKLNATLTGEGTDNPDKSMLNALLNFAISVENWKIIKQIEDDVNS